MRCTPLQYPNVFNAKISYCSLGDSEFPAQFDVLSWHSRVKCNYLGVNPTIFSTCQTWFHNFGVKDLKHLIPLSASWARQTLINESNPMKIFPSIIVIHFRYIATYKNFQFIHSIQKTMKLRTHGLFCFGIPSRLFLGYFFRDTGSTPQAWLLVDIWLIYIITRGKTCDT